MTKVSKKGIRDLHPEEERLWRSVTALVPPLQERSKQYALSPSRRANIGSEISPRFEERGSSAGERLPRRRRKDTRPSIDARLDLHGLNQARAHAALKSFLLQETMAGSAVVLVITGVGAKPGSGIDNVFGVLKTNVPLWLATFGQYVSKVTEAHMRDGGSGALYVHLKKGRKRGS